MNVHVPAAESSFLGDNYEAVCSCGWRAEYSDGVPHRYTTFEFALEAARAHAAAALPAGGAGEEGQET